MLHQNLNPAIMLDIKYIEIDIDDIDEQARTN